MEQQPSSFGGASLTEALPYEVLEEICKYLPKKDRENFALVCKTFYEMVCEVERYKRPLVLTNYVINQEFVDGMLLSKRKIKKVGLQAIGETLTYTRKELAWISIVLQEHPEIKILELRGWLDFSGIYRRRLLKFFDADNLRKLLEFMPNLEVFDANYINLRASFFRKLASMSKLQQVFIKVDCYRTRWNPAVGTSLMELIQRLSKYKICFDRTADTIKGALENNFGVKRDLSWSLVLERL